MFYFPLIACQNGLAWRFFWLPEAYQRLKCGATAEKNGEVG